MAMVVSVTVSLAGQQHQRQPFSVSRCHNRAVRVCVARKCSSRAIPELVPPSIDNDLHDLLRDHGADISEDRVVQSFGKDEEALHAAESTCAIVEMSHFGRLRITGDDRLRFLHNQSTADFLRLNEGEGCDTVFLTPTARTIDLATAWVMKSSVILLVSPNRRSELVKMLNKYIFFADKVEVEDITEKTCFLALVGPESSKVMKQLNLEHIIDKPYGTHFHCLADGTPITVGVGSGLSTKGYSFLLSAASAGIVWEVLLKAGLAPMGATGWERLRILQGRPAAGKELTEESNVLEAGLWKTISLTKGCYMGQETVARLITYDGVKQHLFGVKLEGSVEPGTPVTVNDVQVGKLTSCTEGRSSPYFGLAYIRRRAGGAGLKVHVGDISGTIVEVSYLAERV